MSLTIKVHTPGKLVSNTTTEEVFIPIEVGHFTVKQSFQRHSSAIGVGLLRFKDSEGKWILLIVTGGMVQSESNSVVIFVSEAEAVDIVDTDAIKVELKKKQEEKVQSAFDKMDNLREISKLKGILQAAKFL